MHQGNLILIPARKGSKSIKKKNIKLFNNKPLIYWTIKLAIEANLGKVCVSTNCKKIKAYALSLGAEAPFLRPEKISKDNTPTEPVIKHALNFYKNKKKINFDLFFLLQPTSPFRKKNDLIEALNILRKNKKSTSVLSASKAEANNNPCWMIIQNKEGKAIKYTNKGPLHKLLPRRQLLPTVYYRNDFVYLSRVKNIFSKNCNIYGNYPVLLISSEERVEIDINTKKEWLLAEMLFKKMKKSNKKF
jgi:CMP-N,N'-diacetyllegionaminic acid synthase|tara:strand:- start:1748 stop:2485 length:738 start_codon:yes stop_codon:yes gene_type:complete